MAGGDAWLDNIKGDALAPVVLPKLGSCYLRHHDGLALIGRLLDWLASTRRRCLMACDSWAWAYLVNALQIDTMLPTPLTLAPLDGRRLQFWLPTLARTNGGRFVFRDAGNGEAAEVGTSVNPQHRTRGKIGERLALVHVSIVVLRRDVYAVEAARE